jgi:hypothetical protein
MAHLPRNTVDRAVGDLDLAARQSLVGGEAARAVVGVDQLAVGSRPAHRNSHTGQSL